MSVIDLILISLFAVFFHFGFKNGQRYTNYQLMWAGWKQKVRDVLDREPKS